MPETEKPCIDEGRRLERRRISRFAFIFLFVFATLVTGMLLFHPDRLDISAALEQSTTLLNGVLVAFASIILTYVGASAWEKVSETKHSAPPPRGRILPKETKGENPVPPADYPSGGNGNAE